MILIDWVGLEQFKFHSLFCSFMKNFFYLSTLVFSSSFILGNVSHASEFNGFKSLDVARDNVRLGALWQQGTGPIGLETSRDNTITSKSFNGYDIQKNFDLDVTASIYGLLGISPKIQKNVKLNLEGVEVVTVKDLTQLNITNGNNIIYEALRVKGFTLDIINDANAEIETAILEKFGNSTISADSNYNKKIQVKADNLFVAYRVITIKNARVKEKTKKITDKPVKLDGYTFNIYPDKAISCMCPGIGSAVSLAVSATCRAKNPLTIVAENPKLGNINQGGLHLKVTQSWEAPLQAPIRLDYRQKSGGIEVDLLRVNAYVSNMIYKSCLRLEDYQLSEESSLKLTKIRYELTPLKRPQAPGW